MALNESYKPIPGDLLLCSERDQRDRYRQLPFAPAIGRYSLIIKTWPAIYWYSEDNVRNSKTMISTLSVHPLGRRGSEVQTWMLESDLFGFYTLIGRNNEV
tara:strand:+ start:423 stop:725 length:303 start_codon:yes stop_codon:yes gene_type:complete